MNVEVRPRVGSEAAGGCVPSIEGAEVEAKPVTSHRFLVVEDYEDLAQATRLVLEHHGHVVITAHNGSSALNALDAFRPDVVLLDIRLPDCSGYELAARLRQHPNASHAKLVALTPAGHSVDWAATRSHGFAARVIKPFDPGAVLDVILAGPPDDAREHP